MHTGDSGQGITHGVVGSLIISSMIMQGRELWQELYAPDRKTGIGNWSEDDIIGVLTDGHTPDLDFVGGAMAEVVKNTARLSEEDRRAIAVFLQAVPAVSSQK